MRDVVSLVDATRPASLILPFEAARRAGQLATAGRHANLRRWIGRIALVAMIAWLVWQLQAIGWSAVWRARPRAFAFYAIVVAGYFALPVADTLIYGRLLGLPFPKAFPALLRKRIYNAALIGYSGELFLLMWARARVVLSDGRLALLIKDSNVLSAIASTLVCLIVLLCVLANWQGQAPAWLWLIPALLLAMLVPMIFVLRLGVDLLEPGAALLVLGIHLIRFVVTQGLQLGQWAVQLPDASIAVLARLLALQMLVSRVPLLPGRDLLFIGAGLALSGPLAIPQAALAGMLVSTSALQLAMHLVVFVATSFPPRHSSDDAR